MKAITEDSGCGGDVSVSDVVQYHFCPRKVYYLRIAGLRVPARPKMRLGTEEHKKERKRAKERQVIYGFASQDVAQVLHNVYVEADCGLYGQIDTLVTLTNGDVVPIEVKYSDRTAVFRQWKKQLVAYALLLNTLGHRVTYGLIYLSNPKKLVKVEIIQEDLNDILSDVKKIRNLLRGERIPRGVRDDKCAYCEVRKFCVK